MPIQLRFMDGDQFGHVNNSIYFQFYDTAKIDYFSVVCPEIVKNYAIVVVHLDADFMSQVFTKDEVEVQTRIAEIGHKSFTFVQRLVDARSGEVKCEGRTVMVVYDTRHEQTLMFKPEWREAISKYEGENL